MVDKKRINSDIRDHFMELGASEEVARFIVMAIAHGLIPRVKINYKEETE